MPKETNRLKLPLPLGNENVTRESINRVFEKIDAGVATQADLDTLLEAVSKMDIPDASLTQKGKVQLSNKTDGTSETVAATEKAVREVAQELNVKTNHAVSEAKMYSDTLMGALSNLQTNVKGNIVGAINELFQSGVNVKVDLVAAINAIGGAVTTNQSFKDIIANLRNNMVSYNSYIPTEAITPVFSWNNVPNWGMLDYGDITEDESYYSIGYLNSNYYLVKFSLVSLTTVWQVAANTTGGRFLCCSANSTANLVAALYNPSITDSNSNLDLQIYNATTGALLRTITSLDISTAIRYDVNDPLYRFVKIDDSGNIYIGGLTNRVDNGYNVIKIDGNTGRVKWTYSITNGYRSPISNIELDIKTGDIYIAEMRTGSNGTVKKLDPNGNQVWTYASPSTLYSFNEVNLSTNYNGKKVVFANQRGNYNFICVINADTGILIETQNAYSSTTPMQISGDGRGCMTSDKSGALYMFVARAQGNSSYAIYTTKWSRSRSIKMYFTETAYNFTGMYALFVNKWIDTPATLVSHNYSSNKVWNNRTYLQKP
ncbi:tail fiber protein [Paenibacillus amylolyticus]|uniref:tail fiber protein n=1 Tax=Paenibacillus amylolyticus TaxID=1451 RepID=UPI003EB947BC